MKCSSTVSVNAPICGFLEVTLFPPVMKFVVCFLICVCSYVCLFVLLLYVPVNSYGHGGRVSSPNHSFSWANLNKQLTNNSCIYFCLQLATTLLEWISGREENNRRNYCIVPGQDLTHNPWICSQMRICNTPIPHRPRIATNWFFFIRGDLWGFIKIVSPIVMLYEPVPIQIRCR